MKRTSMPATAISKAASPSRKKKLTPWERFPYPVLGAWLIAEHSFCEQRVHLWLQAPGERVSVPRQLEGAPVASSLEGSADLGRSLHEALAEPAKEILPEDLSGLEASGELYHLVETPFGAEYDGLPLLGRPDVVVLQKRRALMVIDYKSTGSTQLPMGCRVQLYVYGYLLEQNGYDTEDLILACVLIPPANAELIANTSAEVIEAVIRKVNSSRERAPEARNWTAKKWELSGVPAILRSFPYDRERAIRELAFVSDYWHGRRGPIPSTKVEKCRCCLYNKLRLCKHAVTGYSESSGAIHTVV